MLITVMIGILRIGISVLDLIFIVVSLLIVFDACAVTVFVVVL